LKNKFCVYNGDGILMKVSDFVFRSNNFEGRRSDSLCRVRIFVGVENRIFSVITDLGEKNTGMSVTNSIEKIKKNLILKGYIVTFDKNNNPSWESINLKEILCQLLCDQFEFSICSLDIKYIYDEIEKIRHDIDPFIDEPWPEAYDVINRREDIQKGMLPISVLQEAIVNGSTEIDLQNLIKSDLSILGDFYAHPSEEYICFSEFPLDGGFIDFVIFSGVSKMNVTLIEIKGASYNLVNCNSYEDFSAKTNQAVQQIRRRLGYITRNYEEFRKLVHEVRHSVEAGESRFNSFVGPKGRLGVDPNKDIYLHTVVIGGRSKDDLNESRLRYEYERGQSPSIRVESWDSWIKKLKRH
jgi:hypothetical protein